MLESTPVLSPAEARERYAAARERLVGKPKLAAAPLPIFVGVPLVELGAAPEPARSRKTRLLLELVRTYYGVSEAELLGRQRAARPQLARMVAMKIARVKLEYTFDKLGDIFGRAGCAVLQAVARGDKRAEWDSELRDDIAVLSQRLDDALRARL